MTDMSTQKKVFLNTIATTIIDFKMLEQNDRVLVTVSGGPDSIALVLALLSFRKKYCITMGIAHLNHMLREEESLRDETFVKEFAHNLGLPFHCRREDVADNAKTHGLSIEESGREVRYDFFKHLAQRHGYKKVATGHHKDDNAELVLMNLLRGTGPKGLCGIPPIRGNLYIRPLIRVSKKQITDFLTMEQQTSMFDSSNKNKIHLRNKIRSELIPHLQSEYNPGIIDGLDRLSHILKQEEAFLYSETKKQFTNCRIKTDVSSVTFSKIRLSELHPAILNRVLRKAIKTVKKNLNRITLSHLNDILTFCFNSSSGISLDLPGQIRVYKEKDTITIRKESKPLRQVGKKQKQLKQMDREK